MLNKVKEILAKRKLIDDEHNYENDYEIEKCWNLLTDILGRDENQTVEIINQLNETEIFYLSEVFEDISEKLQSEKYIRCLQDIGKKYTDEGLERSIEIAKEFYRG